MGSPWSQPEEDGGGDKAGELILNQYGVPDAWSQPEEDEDGDEAGGLILSQYGVLGARSQVRGLNMKRVESGTRPESLFSTVTES